MALFSKTKTVQSLKSLDQILVTFQTVSTELVDFQKRTAEETLIEHEHIENLNNEIKKSQEIITKKTAEHARAKGVAERISALLA